MKKKKRKPTPEKVLKKLKNEFRQQLGLGKVSAEKLLSNATIYDKAYELSCLIKLIEKLRSHIPGARFKLINGINICFRAHGGAINRADWPHIDVEINGIVEAEIWVDIEFLALSGQQQGKIVRGHPYGLAHELDLVLVEPNAIGRPKPEQIFIGVEAKHRTFNKALLKELLGVRREMTFCDQDHPNKFAWWASSGKIPSNPPSGLVLFCSQGNLNRYRDPADFWGIEFIHHAF